MVQYEMICGDILVDTEFIVRLHGILYYSGRRVLARSKGDAMFTYKTSESWIHDVTQLPFPLFSPTPHFLGFGKSASEPAGTTLGERLLFLM